MFSPYDRKENLLWLVKSFLTPISFRLKGGRIAPRSVRLNQRKGSSPSTSYFLESGTAGCLPFSNLASPSVPKHPPNPKISSKKQHLKKSAVLLSFLFLFLSISASFFRKANQFLIHCLLYHRCFLPLMNIRKFHYISTQRL